MTTILEDFYQYYNFTSGLKLIQSFENNTSSYGLLESAVKNSEVYPDINSEDFKQPIRC